MKDIVQILAEWNEKPHLARNPKGFQELKRKTRLMTPDEDMARVNPNISRTDSFRLNCSYCSATYDLRRRGYDVEADDYLSGDIEPNIFEIYSWWTHPKKGEGVAIERVYPGYRYFETDKHSIKEIEDAVRRNGTRGQISFIWKEGKAHSVIYEVSYGQVLLRDCQHNRKLRFEDYAKLSKRIYFFRTDNEQPTDRILNCVVNKASDSYFRGDNPMDSLMKILKANGYKAKYFEGNIRVYLSDRYLDIDGKGNVKDGSILDERRRNIR